MQLRIALVALLLALPTAAAGWSVKGSWEPDTTMDRTQGWMFQEPDRSPTGERVYLNGFFGTCTFPCYWPAFSSFNPNVGVAQTSTGATLMMAYAAFGVWKDCNKDGYIGLGEQGLTEYRAELLVGDVTVCPVKSTPIVPQTGKPPAGWFPSHNDGVWVREFLPFAGDETNETSGQDRNPWDIDAPGAMVWMDFGKPGAARDPATAGCGINPHPYGTLRSTGGMVEYVDCQTDWKATDTYDSIVAGAGGDNLGAGQLSFKDKPRDQSESRSLMNQKNPWGTDTDASFVEPWDCTSDQPVHAKQQSDDAVATAEGVTGVPLGGGVMGGREFNLSMPRVPPGVSATGSPGGTANATGSGFDECHRTTENDDSGNFWGGVLGGRWHPGHSLGNLPYQPTGYLVVEGGGGARAPGKQGADASMFPSMGPRPAAPFAVALGKAAPPEAGFHPASSEGWWLGGPILATNFFADPVNGAVLPVTFTTTYAFVPTATQSAHSLLLPKGTALGKYGAEACGGATSGIVKGWDCNAANWGSPKIGQDYQLRDVDCYDHSVTVAREAGVGWGLLTDTRCT